MPCEVFRPVLLWEGHVALDARGRATVDVPLSDNLSAFRLVAIATDGSQYFGAGETSVRTVQDLAVFAGLPELVRTGDSYDARFTLRNGTARTSVVEGKSVSVRVDLGGRRLIKKKKHTK